MIEALSHCFFSTTPLRVKENEFYPDYIQQIFNKYLFIGESLPLRNLGKLTGNKNRIFSFINYQKLPSAVSRIEGECGRQGLAVIVLRREQSRYKLSNTPRVLILFPVEENGVLIWRANAGSSLAQELSRNHEEKAGHDIDETCSSCPFSPREPIQGQLLEKLFSGTHPDIFLVSPSHEPYALFPPKDSYPSVLFPLLKYLGFHEKQKRD